jgi:hypothetical protein
MESEYPLPSSNNAVTETYPEQVLMYFTILTIHFAKIHLILITIHILLYSPVTCHAERLAILKFHRRSETKIVIMVLAIIECLE